MINAVGKMLGVDGSMLGTGLMLLLSFALVPQYRKQRTAEQRHWFSIAASALAYTLLFGSTAFVQIVALAVVVYAVAAHFRGAYWAPFVVFLLTMAVLGANHLYVQWIAKQTAMMDATAPMMVQVMKLTSFVWSAHDGTCDDSTLSDSQRKRAIKRMPTLLEFIGYITFFPSFLIGPTFPFMDYLEFTERTGDFEVIPPTAAPAIQCVAASFMPLLFMLSFGPYYSHAKLADPQFVSRTRFSQRFVYLIVAASVAKTVFYVGWKLAEGACIFIGLGYNGRDSRGYARWDRVENCDIIGVELAENPRAAIASWNKNTALWLREDVYERLEAAQFTTTEATTITFLVSAYWHGVHFGYYISFLFLSVVTMVARLLRKYLRPLFASPRSKLRHLKPLYDVAGMIATFVSISYVMAGFATRDVATTFRMYQSVYFCGHIVLMALVVGFETGQVQSLLEQAAVNVGATIVHNERPAVAIRQSSGPSVSYSVRVKKTE